MKKRKIKLMLAAVMAAILLCLPISASAAEEAEVAEVEVAAEKNVFELGYEAVLAHSDEILSALSFLGAVTVGFAYKKGLVPTLNEALARLRGTVNGIKESTEQAQKERDTEMKLLKTGLTGLEDTIADCTEAMSAVDRRLSDIGEDAAQLSSLKAVMRAQVEMLYDIFISSALPEYQKESVGMRINEMKKLLEAEGKNE